MRHAPNQGRRKPTTRTRIAAVSMVGAGAAAATILAPAAAANAADGTQWNRVAQCESDQEWHINTGNGYYGGLQFSETTWNSYDTDHYASRADLASRAQQIVVANRVLASQGWGAWPVCSRDAGAPSPSDPATHAKKPTKTHTTLSHPHWLHYTVKHGDSLESIAGQHHVKGGWKAVYRANRAKIGGNPSALRVGEKLQVHARKAS